jgi:hypothetical protein
LDEGGTWRISADLAQRHHALIDFEPKPMNRLSESFTGRQLRNGVKSWLSSKRRLAGAVRSPSARTRLMAIRSIERAGRRQNQRLDLCAASARNIEKRDAGFSCRLGPRPRRNIRTWYDNE